MVGRDSVYELKAMDNSARDYIFVTLRLATRLLLAMVVLQSSWGLTETASCKCYTPLLYYTDSCNGRHPGTCWMKPSRLAV